MGRRVSSPLKMPDSLSVISGWLIEVSLSLYPGLCCFHPAVSESQIRDCPPDTQSPGSPLWPGDIISLIHCCGHSELHTLLGKEEEMQLSS